MKSILFASTALVAFAGAAAAQDISLSGSAEMGVVFFDSLSPVRGDVDLGNGNILTNQLLGFDADNTTSFHTDIDVTFAMTGETDNGLEFGGTVDLDENNAFGNTTQGGEVIFIKGAFGALTMGDTDGALDWALSEVDNGGSIADDHTAHTGFNGNAGLDGLYDGQIARYDYSFGGFGVALSAELDDADGDDNSDVFGLGLKYALDLGGNSVDLGFGYQTAERADVDVDTYGLSAKATFGAITAGISYVHYENHIPGVTNAFNIAANDDDDQQAGRILTDGDDTDHVGIGIGYSAGALSLSANYGKYDSDTGIEADGVGIAAGYDLGGGASILMGIGHSDIDDGGTGVVDGDFTTVSLGVSMSF